MAGSGVFTTGFEARLQARDERVGALALRRLRKAHDLARGLRRDHVADLLLILIAELARVEAILERADQLLGERDLALVGRTARARLERTDLDDLVRVAQRVEQQVPAARLQRADVAPVTQHPV